MEKKKENGLELLERIVNGNDRPEVFSKIENLSNEAFLQTDFNPFDLLNMENIKEYLNSDKYSKIDLDSLMNDKSFKSRFKNNIKSNFKKSNNKNIVVAFFETVDGKNKIKSKYLRKRK